MHDFSSDDESLDTFADEHNIAVIGTELLCYDKRIFVTLKDALSYFEMSASIPYVFWPNNGLTTF